MLDGEGELLKRERVSGAGGAVEGDAQGMRGELGVEAGAQAPAALGVVLLDVQVFAELLVHRLDDLALARVQRHGDRRELGALVGGGS